MLAQMAKRSKTAIIAFKIYDNWRVKRAASRGVAETQHGSTHSHKMLADSVRYIQQQFDDYLQYGELTPELIARWAHLPLVFGDDGTRLAKRHGAITLEELIDAGRSAPEIREELFLSANVDSRPGRSSDE